MTSERLASIRLRLGNARFHLGESDRLVEERSKAYRIPLSGTILEDTADLLAHVDHLTAENARLRAGVSQVISDCTDPSTEPDWDFDHDPKGVIADVLATLLNPPTEGETDGTA